MGREFLVRADGGARGNPGAAAFGAVVYENGKVIKEIFETIGIASNNVAEYRGLIAGLNADRKSTRLNSSHEWISRMPSSA